MSRMPQYLWLNVFVAVFGAFAAVVAWAAGLHGLAVLSTTFALLNAGVVVLWWARP